MNISKTSVSELICTRISHDLIGNIGAVSNAVELLEEGDLDFLDDIRSILKTSSQVLSARLKFFRMAFGLNNANLEDKNLVVKTCEDYLKTIGNQNYPISLQIGEYSSALARIIMLCTMMMADVVVKGGMIEIAENAGKLFVKVSTSAKLAEQKISATADILSGNGGELTAQYAPVFYLRELTSGVNLQVTAATETAFEFVIG